MLDYIWKKEHSFYYKKVGDNEYKFNTILVVCNLLRGIQITISWFNYYTIIVSSNLARVSVSVMFSLACCTTFTSAISFYFFYKEKLMLKHIMAMVLLCISVIILGISKQDDSSDDVDDSLPPRISIAFPMLTLLVQVALYTFNLTITRYILSQGYSSARWLSGYISFYVFVAFICFCY